jgi:hypothetical protein
MTLDLREKRIGESMNRIVADTLRSLSLYTLTTRLHMRIQDLDKLIERAAAEASNPAFKAYFPL